MELQISNINDLKQLEAAFKANKLIVDLKGNPYTVIGIFDTPNGITVQWKSVNKLERFAQIFSEFKQHFKIVDYINLMDDNNFASTNYINQNNNMYTIHQMIQEHKELVPRIEALHNLVYNSDNLSANVRDTTEFANKCVQLKGMKIYEEALSARLFNAGVKISGNEYLIAIDRIEEEHEEDPGDNN